MLRSQQPSAASSARRRVRAAMPVSVRVGTARNRSLASLSAGGGERVGEVQDSAAADVNVAVDLVLEVTDRARAIGAKDRGVAPVRGLQRSGDDVLGRLVHERRAG